jgi:hypothetical protein
MPFSLTAKDVVGPIVSIIAAIVSGVFWWKNFQASKRIANRSIYVDGQKFLIEICKQLMDDPTLWCIYGNPATPDEKMPSFNPVSFPGKLRAFAHLHLNMFEIILNEVPPPGTGNKRNASNVWFDYLDDTLTRSKVIRDVLDEEGSQRIWSEELRNAYLEWQKREKQRIKDIAAQRPLPNPAS